MKTIWIFILLVLVISIHAFDTGKNKYIDMKPKNDKYHL